uniref:Uncharacterized protein n=1 Tax=Setaria italica TaxID=4555 RepID=K3ZG67_SETIT
MVSSTMISSNCRMAAFSGIIEGCLLWPQADIILLHL